MEFLDIPFFDDDFLKMIFRFTINIFFLIGIIKYSYFKYSQKTEYVFTFYLVGIAVFFVCFALKKLELNMGMALGLFAIFGILRYRTQQLEIKDMTYLFIVIAVSIMNSLFNKKMSYSEVVTANLIILFAAYFLEKSFARSAIHTQSILYESIENIHPSKHALLKEDLEKRLGVNIKDFVIENVDFMRDTARINVRYTSD